MTNTDSKYILTLSLAISLTLQTPVLWAAGGRAETTNTSTTVTSPNTTSTTSLSGTTQITTTTTQGTSADGGANTINPTSVVTTTTNLAPTPTATPTISSAANSGGGMETLGMVAGAAGAVFCGYMAYQSYPDTTKVALWTLGAVASAALAIMMMQKKQSADKAAADSTSTAATGSPTPTPASLADPATTAAIADAQKNVNAATSKIPGLSANLSTGVVKLPNGNTINASQLGDPAAMKAAGLSDGDIAAFKDIMNQATAKGQAAAAAKGLDKSDTNGLGDDLAVGSGRSLGGGAGTAASSGAVRAAGRDPAQVEGLTRNYNGEQIGVASDNLFTLINRRYSLHAQQQNFIIPGGANSTTAPAPSH